MTSRERILAAVNHRQPDKVAVDFGATGCTTLHVSCIEQLRDYYGLPQKTVAAMDVFTMAGIVEDDLMDAMGCDASIVLNRKTVFGHSREKLKEWRTPHGQVILVPEAFCPVSDGKGGYYHYPNNDTSLVPSAHMPSGGFYFDALERGEPVDEESMKVEDNLEEYGLLSDLDLRFLKEAASKARATGRASVLATPGTCLGDASEIPGAALTEPKGIRRLEDWYMASLLWPDYVKELFDRQTDTAIANLKRINEEAGENIDIIFLCGADLAHQKGTFIPPALFRELYFPYYKKMNDWIHQHTGWKTIKHNCGAVRPLIPQLIECGFDILNPVQCSAEGMDAAQLKCDFGTAITFWGGGADTQKTLPFGTPSQVREEVLRRCEIFSPGGGFVFDAVHVVQAGTPLENIVAMIDAVKEFNAERP